MNQNKKYKLYVYGCQMNKSDAERVAAVLEEAGFEAAEKLEEADLAVVLACSVRQSAIDRIFGLRKKFEQIRKSRPFYAVLTGCVLDTDKKRLLVRRPTGSSHGDGFFDAVIGISEIGRLEDFARNVRRSHLPHSPSTRLGVVYEKRSLGLRRGGNYFGVAPKHNSKFQAYVPIMNGCNNFCTYCVVPYVRGRETSRPWREVLDECKKLLANGYKEIFLLGQNVNSYRSGKVGFAELLRMIAEIGSVGEPQSSDGVQDTNNQQRGVRRFGKPGDPSPASRDRDDRSIKAGENSGFWLRFVTSHPKNLSGKLIKVIAESKHITPYLHLAVQSGDNQILKKMNRNYTAAHYKRLIAKVRKAVPGVAISTDVIVGFPGETPAQFMNTVKLFQEVKFDMAYIAQYSPRAGTAAARLKDDVFKKEKARRFKALTKILKQTALENNKQLLGRVVTVLVENYKEGFCFGKTGGFKSVKFAGGEKMVGQFVEVEIAEATAWGLTGRINADGFARGYHGLGNKVVVICGTTASGKTKLAVRLAKKFNGEIISADSRQVYRGMDLGTGKDLDDYVIASPKPKAQSPKFPPKADPMPEAGTAPRAEKIKSIPYHIIDIASPKKQYTVAEFQREAYAAIEDILARGRVPILCGGTGLYVDAVAKGYDFISQ